MISRDKMFVVAENIDDSIKSQTSVYDITLFKTFTDFEKFVNVTPVMIDTLVISERNLPFTGQNMSRVINALNSPFLRVTGSVLYLVKEETDLRTVNAFIESRDMDNWAVYQGDLSVKFITDIVVGTGRSTSEGVNEVVTYRIRSSEFIKQQQELQYEDTSGKYYTDEDLLSGIPSVEEPEDINAEQVEYVSVNYVVGEDNMERPLIVFFLAQYFSMQGKTVILEKDTEYHKLGELISKSGIKYEHIKVESLLGDVSETLNRIRNCASNLVFIGTKNRRNYDYNFLMDVLQSNLKEDVMHIIRECDYEEAPYGKFFTVVVPNTVPEVLKCCNSLKGEIDSDMVTFIGVQSSNLGPVNITSAEMQAVIKMVLEKNEVAAQVVRANGVLLKGDNVVYDIFGILNRGN